MKFSEQQTKYFFNIYMQMASGKLDHSNVKGCIWLSSTEMQRVVGDDYKEVMSCFFTVVDENYRPPTANTKGICKAYKATDAFHSFIDKVIKEKPEVISTRKLVKGVKYFFEQINIAALEGIISKGLDFCKNREDLMTARIMRLACDDNGTNAVSYRRTAGEKGRRFATSVSLQTLPKYIRFAVINNVTDIDMVNCHPVLIKAFINKAYENIQTDAIDTYIDDRERALQEIMLFYTVDRAAAKQLVLMVGYGASLDNISGAFGDWISENKAKITIVNNKMINSAFMIAFQSEMRDAKKAILQLPEAGSFNGPNGNRAFSLFIQSVEDEILQLIEGWMSWRERTVVTLMFDGIMIEGEVSGEEIKNLEKNISRWLWKKYDIECEMKLSIKYFQ